MPKRVTNKYGARNRQRLHNYARGRKWARNSGKHWTKFEERAIINNGLSDRIVAWLIGRSLQAIQEKRAKLRKKKWAEFIRRWEEYNVVNDR